MSNQIVYINFVNIITYYVIKILYFNVFNIILNYNTIILITSNNNKSQLMYTCMDLSRSDVPLLLKYMKTSSRGVQLQLPL